LEKICSQLYSEDLEVFYNTINVIKELANPEVIPYLQKYYLAVSDDLKWNRLVVGKTIAFIGKEISCDFFLSDIKRQLKNGNYSFRVCDSLQSIGNIEHAKAYDILLSIINNFEEFDSQIREWASISLHDSNCSKYKNEVLSELQTEDQQAFSDADITKERKDANELFDLGEKYYSGDGIPQNFIEAFRYFKFAADLGLVEAQFNIGLMFYNGHGVQQSYSEALKWYSLAADQGLEEAQYNIGCMFDKGYGVKQDYKEALKWYLLAANEDGESIVRARAIFNVGVFHRDGLGIPQNYNEAAKWTIKAAEMGYDEAQFNLGLMYLYGEGLPENINLAIRWWKFAAEQGNSNAKTNLAVFKSRGLY
jgi:TPR repeat protein